MAGRLVVASGLNGGYRRRIADNHEEIIINLLFKIGSYKECIRNSDE